jgi:hypothetical protein
MKLLVTGVLIGLVLGVILAVIYFSLTTFFTVNRQWQDAARKATSDSNEVLESADITTTRNMKAHVGK